MEQIALFVSHSDSVDVDFRFDGSYSDIMSLQRRPTNTSQHIVGMVTKSMPSIS